MIVALLLCRTAIWFLVIVGVGIFHLLEVFVKLELVNVSIGVMRGMNGMERLVLSVAVMLLRENFWELEVSV